MLDSRGDNGGRRARAKSIGKGGVGNLGNYGLSRGAGSGSSLRRVDTSADWGNNRGGWSRCSVASSLGDRANRS